MNIRAYLKFVPLLTALGLTGCASAVRVDQERGADLSRCRSFAWRQSGEDPISLTDQRVRDAALDALRAKDYEIVDNNADCEASYALDLSARTRSRSSIGFGVGGGSGNFGGGVGLSLPIGAKLHAATLRINVTDSARQTQVWTASLDADVSDPLTSEQATRAVNQLLAKYPKRSELK